MSLNPWRVIILVTLCVYATVLLTLTHMPKPPGVFEGQSDKTLHFTAYMILAWLVYLVLFSYRPGQNYRLAKVLIVCMIFGAVDESTQPLFGRSADVRDYLFDVLGIIVGSGFAAAGCFVVRRYVAGMNPSV